MKSFKSFMTEQIVSGGFNIFRSAMPQIDDQQKFLQFVSDNDFYYIQTEVHMDEIKPTQKDIDMDKVENMPSNTQPIIISSDKFILDGHHRFYRQKLFSEEYFIEVYEIDTTINNLLKLAQDYLNND